MNNKKIYFAFIEKFRVQEFNGEYTEVHHIIPRYAGGDDSEENLVRLTFPQHVFVHKLWARATGDLEAEIAYRLMSGVSKDKRKETAILGGLANKKSGWLDQIRHLANTPERQAKLLELHETMRSNGHYQRLTKLAAKSRQDNGIAEEFNLKRKLRLQEQFKEDEEYKQRILDMQKKGIKQKFLNSIELSNSVIENAKRDETFLQKVSKRSKNKFISPEGIAFDSPIFAAGYYGNVEPHVIENWCKRDMHGWYRLPKTE